MEHFNVLVVYPHPADSATEAAGTVALHAERGDRITSVIATYGERHHMQWLHDEAQKPAAEQDAAIINVSLDQYRDFKKREAERIAEILGVEELMFLGWTDQEVEFSRDRVTEITEIILRLKPDIVISHLPTGMGDVEDDHPVVGQIVMSAVRTAANRVTRKTAPAGSPRRETAAGE